LLGQCYIAGLEVIAVFIGDGDRLGEFSVGKLTANATASAKFGLMSIIA
jgi:hypothetical protein